MSEYILECPRFQFLIRVAVRRDVEQQANQRHRALSEQGYHPLLSGTAKHMGGDDPGCQKNKMYHVVVVLLVKFACGTLPNETIHWARSGKLVERRPISCGLLPVS